jgi:hypothetical protein
VYSSVLAAYTAAIRAKTQALEVVADTKPKADMVIARDTEPSAALAALNTFLAERQAAILNGAKIVVRVDKVYHAPLHYALLLVLTHHHPWC